MGATQVRVAPGQGIWLAFLEGAQLWQTSPAPVQAAVPVPAKWRCSLVRVAPEADSWDLERGAAPNQLAAAHAGPALVYPLDRTPATPLTVTCPTDVMRNTLGVGPCQYILACEGMGAQGDPTPNSVMTWVEKQFQQKREKKAADDIRERLGAMTRHVGEARTRIERYRTLAGELRRALAGQAGGEAFLSRLDELDRAAAAGLTDEVGPEPARQLAQGVVALVGQEDSWAACRQAGERLRALGAVQDRTLAQCRMAVRRLKAESLTRSADAAPTAATREVARRVAPLLQRP